MSLQLWSFVARTEFFELPCYLYGGLGRDSDLLRAYCFSRSIARRRGLPGTARDWKSVQTDSGHYSILIVAGLIEAFVSPDRLPIS